jgi:hypothetical protein
VPPRRAALPIAVEISGGVDRFTAPRGASRRRRRQSARYPPAVRAERPKARGEYGWPGELCVTPRAARPVGGRARDQGEDGRAGRGVEGRLVAAVDQAAHTASCATARSRAITSLAHWSARAAMREQLASRTSSASQLLRARARRRRGHVRARRCAERALGCALRGPRRAQKSRNGALRQLARAMELTARHAHRGAQPAFSLAARTAPSGSPQSMHLCPAIRLQEGRPGSARGGASCRG